MTSRISITQIVKVGGVLGFSERCVYDAPNMRIETVINAGEKGIVLEVLPMGVADHPALGIKCRVLFDNGLHGYMFTLDLEVV